MKIAKRFLCAALAAVSLLSGVSALAADTAGIAQFWRNTMCVEGRPAYSWNANGKQTYYLNYNGSVYVQLRTVAEWMGKEVAWDAATKTITLSGNIAPVYREQTTNEYDELSASARKALMSKGTPVTVRKDITVVIDGKTLVLKDASGRTIYPIVYNGANYLPIRTVAEMLGMTVTFKSGHGSETIFLRTPMSDAELAACKTYVSKLTAEWDKINQLSNTKPKTIDEAKKTLNQCVSAVNVLKNTPKPDCAILDYQYNRIQTRADEAITACNRVQKLIDSNASLEDIRKALYVDWTGEYVYDPDDDDDDDSQGAVSLCLYAIDPARYMGFAVNEEVF